METYRTLHVYENRGASRDIGRPVRRAILRECITKPGYTLVPQQRTGSIRGQQPITSSLQDDTYAFHVPAQTQREKLAIAVGDVRDAVLVRPTPRPELVQLKAQVALPDYLHRSDTLEKDVRAGSVSLVNGSRAVFQARISQPLRAAAIDGRDLKTQGDMLVLPEISVSGFDEHRLDWTDRNGLSAKQPFLLRVNGQDDQPPNINVRRLSEGSVVLDQDLLSFEIRATDDYGVKEVGIQWSGIGQASDPRSEAGGERVIAVGGPTETDLTLHGTFSAARESIAPQTIRIRFFVIDYLPDREPVYSPYLVFQIVDAEQHAIWLTRRLERWNQLAMEVYDRERQLYQANQRIQVLASNQLDRPENRRKMQQQATAERANGRQLEQLTASGEQLVRQAMGNEQFQAETLERWAAALHTLKDIAGHRMPSVADFLQQAANAPEGDSSSSSAQTAMSDAIEAQARLLAEFAKVADELKEILRHLEGGTFVKRLKAASRLQLQLATEVNLSASKSFGMQSDQVNEDLQRQYHRLAERQIDHGQDVYTIQQDLEAYYQRIPADRFKAVLEEMKAVDIIEKLGNVATQIEQNLPGQSIAHSELLADTLDRWAEQLLGPADSSDESEPASQGGNLPPTIVLEVMRILAKEIQLRDETRSLDQARPGLAIQEYHQRAKPLAQLQQELVSRTQSVTQQVAKLPQASELFVDEIDLLTAVEEVMREARTLLAFPATGQATIAAETEAIELLMRSNRAGSGSGGGRATPGSGQRSGSTNQSALAMLGQGNEVSSTERERNVGQSVGVSGRQFPEEFQAGLDLYFSWLEKGMGNEDSSVD